MNYETEQLDNVQHLVEQNIKLVSAIAMIRESALEENTRHIIEICDRMLSRG